MGRGGVLIWAHPFQPEYVHLWRHVSSQIRPYTDALLTAATSAGTGISRPDDSIAKPGGIWDQALAAHVRGERPVRPGVITELDYHAGSLHPRATLNLWIPAGLTDPTERRRAAIEALKACRYYVTDAAPRVLVLEQFTLSRGADHAMPGETLRGTGPVTVSYSIASENPIQWVQLIRNGDVVQTAGEAAGAWTYTEVTPGYYRLAARDTTGRFLLCNPIFVGGAL